MSMNAASSASHIPEWTVGERLRKAREDSGLSQEDLGREISVSKRQIVYYENNSKTPKHGEFLLWQMITRVPAEWLKTGAEQSNNIDPDNGSHLGESNSGPSHYNVVPLFGNSEKALAA